MNSQQQQQYRMFGIDPKAAALAALGTAGVYGANALLGGEDERWDRTAINTAGNIGGALSGALIGTHLGGKNFGLPGMVAGAISGGMLGGYGSDQLANLVDTTQGLTPEAYISRLRGEQDSAYDTQESARVSPQELIAYHLQSDPIAQQAYYQEQLRQARMQKKEMDRQRALQYQAQMSQMGGM